MHRANQSLLESADGSMATVSTRREKKRAPQKETRIDLTPTGLLMEGDFAQNLTSADAFCVNGTNLAVVCWIKP
jgi:hypothetical protein